MAVDQSKIFLVSGRNGEIYKLPPYPIISDRDPSTRDQAQLGCLWINESEQTSWTLVSNDNGVNTWIVGASLSETLSSLTINPGDLTITTGDLIITAGGITATSGISALDTLTANDTTLTGTVSINDSFNDNTSINGGTSTGTVTIGNSLAGVISVNSSANIGFSSGGLMTVAPATDTQASPSATSTVDRNLISVVFTGFTTAMGASQAWTINSSLITTTSAIFVSVNNLNASTNGAFLTIDGVTQATGSVVISTTNNGAGALGAGDDVHVNVWVLS